MKKIFLVAEIGCNHMGEFKIAKKLIDQAIALIKDKSLQAQLSENIKNLAKPNATEMIVDKIAQLL